MKISCAMAIDWLEERRLFSSISGVVFNDFNRNGVRDHGEKIVVGADVGLKGPLPPGDGFLQSVFAVHHKFRFDSLPPGRYELSASARSDVQRTFTVELKEGEDKVLNLPLRVPTVVSGSVFRRVHGDLFPLGGVKVYLDRNDNGRRDANEEETRTSRGGPAEGNGGLVVFLAGAYHFAHVRSGEFVVRVEVGPHMRVISETPKEVAERGEAIKIEPIVLRREPKRRPDPDPFWMRRLARS